MVVAPMNTAVKSFHALYVLLSNTKYTFNINSNVGDITDVRLPFLSLVFFLSERKIIKNSVGGGSVP